MSTVEELLQTVLQDKNAKIFKQDGQLTVAGNKAYKNLIDILNEVNSFITDTDFNGKYGTKNNFIETDQNYDLIYRGYLDLLDHLYLYFNYNHLNNPDLNPINYDKMIEYNTAINIEVLFIIDLYETYYEDRISEDLWNNIYKLIYII